MAIKRLNQQGVNLVELMIAVGIMATMAASVILARNFVAKQTVRTSDKIFATQKAIQMFEELKALANTGGTNGVLTLDNYSDGSKYNDILTTDKNVTAPTDPLSSNKTLNGYWKFWRQVEVNHIMQDPFARIVDVKVYGGLTGNKADTGTLLAQVGGIVRVTFTPKPPTQVYDIYEIAISNELGWFTNVPLMDTTFDTACNAVTTLNPGLEFRKHKVIQTAFGRDFYYNPYVNSAVDTASAVMPWIYFYPGLTPQTSGSSSGTDMNFFDPGQLGQVGGINVDGSIQAQNGYSMCDMYNTAMRYPDELAAYQAVSLSTPSSGTPLAPTLRMLLEEMCSQPASMNNPLLISMHGEVLPLVNMRNYSDAAKDPTNQSGDGGQNWRIVTHPQLIHNPSGTSVTLRVYGYEDGLLNPSNLPAMSPNTPTTPMATLYFPNLTLGTSDLSVTAIVGGYVAGAAVSYKAYNLNSGIGNAQMNMYWTMGSPGIVAGDTAITLYNTPLRCQAVTIAGAGGSTTGLDSNYLLYNAEYIPCPVTTTTNFNTDLTTTGGGGPVNTARWVIVLKSHGNGGGAIPDGQYAVETRFGGNVTVGDFPAPASTDTVHYNQMSNLSRTYVWIGTGNNSSVTWGGSGVTPFTERYQYNGDPRHEPYLDCKFGSTALGTQDSGTNIDPYSYNNFWITVGSGDGYSGFTQTYNGFNGQPTGTGTYGDVRDMPRYYYTYRNALLQSTGIFTNLNGWTCWHASEGGEIGGTYDPFASSLKFIDQPWNPSDNTGTVHNFDEVQDSNNWNPAAITGAVTHTTARDVMYYNPGANLLIPTATWYAKWWLGEMYPDSSAGATNYAVTWINSGNLPVSQFWRVPFEAISILGDNNGLDLGRHIQWGVGSVGPAAFANGVAVGSGASTWGLACDGGNGGGNPFASDISTLGVNLYNTTNLVLGSPVSANNTRPWECYYDIGSDGTKLPPQWGNYSGIRTILSVPTVSTSSYPNRIIYTSEDTNSSGNLKSSPATWKTVGVMEMDMGTTQTCYINLSGLAPQGSAGPLLPAQTGINTMLRTYLDGGLIKASGTVGHIIQLPLFQVSTGNPANQFTNPTAVTLSWSSPVSGASLWTRWAGANNQANYYTEEYPGYNAASILGGSVTNSTYTEPVTLFYVPMWSPDQQNWISAIDNATTMTTGNYYVPAALATTLTSVTWNVSSPVTFPQSTYSVRVDGFRQGYPLHYSYHEVDDISFTR